MMLMALKIAPAMVAGNAVVVKSAEEAPFAVLRACQIMNQILPPGVLNVVTADRELRRRSEAVGAQAQGPGWLLRLL